MKSPFFFILASAIFTPQLFACDNESVSYNSTNNTINVSGSNTTCTIPEIAQIINTPSVLANFNSNENEWLLKANLLIEDGARLNIYGSNYQQGTVKKLYLYSSYGIDVTVPDYIWVNAQWGQIDIRSTFIASYDPKQKSEDKLYQDGSGRAYIRVRSLASDKESRLDIVDSEVSYLGYHYNERWGITWKVAGRDFDNVDVYGDLINSYMHHNYRGHYSWGAYGSVIHGNEISHSGDYGVDPHDDSDYLIITDNYIHNNVGHGIICSKRCDNLIISGNQLENNRNGIMLHELITDTVVSNNQVFSSRNTGIVVYDSTNNIIEDNLLDGNRIGMRALVGAQHNIFRNNIVNNSEEYGLFVSKGSGVAKSGSSQSSFNQFLGNKFSNNPDGIFILESNNTILENNNFTDNGNIYIKDAFNTELLNNQFNNQAINVKLRNNTPDVLTSHISFHPNLSVSLEHSTQLTLRTAGTNKILTIANTSNVETTTLNNEQTFSLPSGSKSVSGIVETSALEVTPISGVIVSDMRFNGQSQKSFKLIDYLTQTQRTIKLSGFKKDYHYQVLTNKAHLTNVKSNQHGEVEFKFSANSNQQTHFEFEQRIHGGTFGYLMILLLGTCLVANARKKGS